MEQGEGAFQGARPGALFVCSTPIGNLDDITYRVAETLKNVDVILSEDTRRTVRILNHLGIKTRLLSLHQFNEQVRVNRVISLLQSGQSVALVSDAGTPLISDPGYLLVRAVLEAGFQVTSLPGPSALLPALVLSGLPPSPFLFLGFLPRKGKARKEVLEKVQSANWTCVIYESPYRLMKTLDELAGFFGSSRDIAVARELTKKFEEVVRGTFEEVLEHFRQGVVKGEIVIIIGPER